MMVLFFICWSFTLLETFLSRRIASSYDVIASTLSLGNQAVFYSVGWRAPRYAVYHVGAAQLGLDVQK